MRAIEITEPGGPDVLHLRERPAPTPGPGEILVDVRAIGVNFFDTAIRRLAETEVPGVEGAGVVTALGEGVHDVAPGDRVAWLDMTFGSYAEQIARPATSFVRIPDAIDDETAAALLVQGLTAHHNTTVCHATQPGDIALVHAAAGGVGLMTTQLVKARGGTVIGLVSHPDKVAIASAAGADHVLVSTGGAFVDRVRELTAGEGVHVVFDGAGAATFDASLSVLRTHGTFVFYGPLIGTPPTIRLSDLPRSIRITYPTPEDHVRTRAALVTHTTDLFTLVASGALTVHIGARFPLADAARAHTAIESRTTTGKLLLIP